MDKAGKVIERLTEMRRGEAAKKVEASITKTLAYIHSPPETLVMDSHKQRQSKTNDLNPYYYKG